MNRGPCVKGRPCYRLARPPWTRKGASGSEQGSQGLLSDARPGAAGATHTLRLQCGSGGPQARWGQKGVSPTPGRYAQGIVATVPRGQAGAASLAISRGTRGTASLFLFPPVQPPGLGQRVRLCSSGASPGPRLHKGSPAPPPAKPSLGACTPGPPLGRLCAQGGPACPSSPLPFLPCCLCSRRQGAPARTD